jgi:hypothetical protein
VPSFNRDLDLAIRAVMSGDGRGFCSGNSGKSQELMQVGSSRSRGIVGRGSSILFSSYPCGCASRQASSRRKGSVNDPRPGFPIGQQVDQTSAQNVVLNDEGWKSAGAEAS